MIFMLPVPSKDIFQATCRAVHLSSHGADAKRVASPPGGFHRAAGFFFPPDLLRLMWAMWRFYLNTMEFEASKLQQGMEMQLQIGMKNLE